MRRCYLIILSLLLNSCNSVKPIAPDAAVQPASASTTPPQWIVSAEKDKMDDRPQALLLLDSEEQPRATLIVRCKQGKPEVFINTRDVLESEQAGGRNIRVRFDDEKPQPDVWRLSAGETGLFSENPRYLLTDLLETSTFRIEYRPFERNPRTVSFKTAGLKEAIAPVAAACGAKLN